MCNPNLKGQKQLLRRGPLISSSTHLSLSSSFRPLRLSPSLLLDRRCSLGPLYFSMPSPRVLFIIIHELIDNFSQISSGSASSCLTPLLVYVTSNLSFVSPKPNTYSLKALCPSSVPFSVSGFTSHPSFQVSDLPFSHHPLHVIHCQVSAVSVL